MRERPVSDVPAWIWAMLAATLGLQVTYATWLGTPRVHAEDLPTAPAESSLRLAALGEPAATGKLLMLWLQAFDFQTGTRIPYRNLDYARVEAWLERILALDPVGQYPLMSASRLYAEVPDEAKKRRMLALIHREYLRDPERRWPWLAHATYVAKHQLKDLPLARKFAVALQQNTKSPDVPMWVTQMEAFILEDMDELEQARIMIGGLIASGKIQDERELQLLDRRLRMLEERIKER